MAIANTHPSTPTPASRGRRHVFTDERPVISLKALQREGYVVEGELKGGFIQLPHLSRSRSCRVAINLCWPYGPVAWFECGLFRERQTIAMQWAPYVGGGRYFFVCPVTMDRCDRLYLHRGELASRKGHGLVYRSQFG